MNVRSVKFFDGLSKTEVPANATCRPWSAPEERMQPMPYAKTASRNGGPEIAASVMIGDRFECENCFAVAAKRQSLLAASQ